ncbi:hypothetical protein B0H13DRAFT_1483587, partial [Mycena leptocephala]
YHLIGQIIGKAMYEGILVHWVWKGRFLDDLASLGLELYNGLIFLKHCTRNAEDHEFHHCGRRCAMNKENRHQYIYLISHYRLGKQTNMQSVLRGLSEIIDP